MVSNRKSNNPMEHREMKTYTVEEATEILKVSVSTLRRWIREGKVKTSRIGRRYLITEEEINRLLSSGKEETA